ncbi:MAG: mannonate dehydratase [Cyclobacteriaceae bacterium]|nr:mannonate dehydratase [Cyclobacteriaceae bacterium]
MKFSMLLPAKEDPAKWTLARQIGVEYAITKASTELSGLPDPSHFQSLQTIKNAFNKAGFTLYGLEGDQFDMSSIKLGRTDRNAVIEKYHQMLRNMGKLEIPLLCYNFMASIGWFRTRVDIKERGGALVSGFYNDDVGNEFLDPDDCVSENKLWENLFYFLDAVLPVAQEAGVTMALHPDDPPVSPLKGVGRILTSPEAFEKVYERHPAKHNAITFCQATFGLMTTDIAALAAKWLKEDRIAFLHLRDVTGDKYNFRETFHDNGPTDMAAMMLLYCKHGFKGPVRPDHAPAMYGERQVDFKGSTSVGYGVSGKIFAIGYLKGLYDMANCQLSLDKD